MNNYLLLGGILLIFLVEIFFNIYRERKINKLSVVNQAFLIDKFTTYISILKFFMEESYRIIYNNFLLLNDIEGYKINNDEKIKYSKDFVSLTFKFMCPNFESFFIKVFGNRETLIFYMLRYFEEKEEEKVLEKDYKTLATTGLDEAHNGW